MRLDPVIIKDNIKQTDKHRVAAYVLTVLIVALAALFMTGCGAGDDEGITSIEQLNEKGRIIGVLTDTADYRTVEQELPDARIMYFKGELSAYPAVAEGKIDAFVYDKLVMEIAIHNGLNGVRVLDETIGEGYRGAVAFSPRTKINGLEDSFNTFFEECEADGTIDEMRRRWMEDFDYDMPDIPAAEDPGLHLVVGTTGSNPPFTFYRGTELAGYDIELAKRFAARLGASLEFKVYDYEGIVAAAQGGDVDCIFANLFITPEREQAIRFSVPTYNGGIGVMVRDTGAAGGFFDGIVSFASSLRDSFEKTFIREDRWKLFISGIGTTMLITIMSIIFGTMLGFLVFMMCRNGNRAANRLTGIFVWLIDGMPVVVLLMILYYVVFTHARFSGTTVSIIGFTLIFGASVFSMIKAGVGAIDIGQTEAAYALGYTNRGAFYRIVLPQAMPHFMPAYKTQITALIKATAVVGYVAVQDLTKVGDIVRSRTYEAFFPLVAVAIIYFVLAAVLTLLVNRVEIGVDPKRRTPEDIMKWDKEDR